MYQILEELNKTSGITGSMLVGNDGIIIAADLDTRFQDETVGALAASIVSTVQKSLERLKTTALRQMTIEGEQGKLFLTDVGFGILVVTTEPNVNIGLIRLEIKNTATKIKERNF
ncbi:MAG: roadblock/LC7 domain-containing protein [candidate division Zixibacteria bacterium]|jgi:predicted regulator of Ras-like GTPase activity (Roadblock/LC7/MglB family)|nr:roadblock/LC7 domain-containing protein [candidate division Zixibacteria bacterium]